MSQFRYTLPSGAEFVVSGPAGATQAEADRIFYEQVAAGSLVGYTAGQTLTSLATRITKFELSRLDRTTAGVDTIPVLSINQGTIQGTITGISNGQVAVPNNQIILSAIEALPLPTSMPNLSQVLLSTPIDQADIVLNKGDGLGADEVGPLNSDQIQRLLAQIVNLVNQPYNVISQEKGIGAYGFNAYALEEAGYVKPGTSLRFFAVDPEDFVSVMSSPSVWTGKDGVTSVDVMLEDPQFQNRIQVEIMDNSYNQLTAAGVISRVPTSAVSVSRGQVYTNAGLSTISALSAAGGSIGNLTSLLKNSNVSASTLSRLLATPLSNLSTIGSGAVNSLGGLTSLASLPFSSITSGLTSKITGDIGALVTNASKFGTNATALWAKAGGLPDLSNLASGGLSSITSGLTGLTTNISGLASTSLTSITSQLTNLVPGSLSNLTANLDVFGKAGQFATNFGNLGDFNALSGQLTGALSGQLGQLSGALSGQLGALSGQLTGALGSLGNFANLGSLADVFGGAFGGGGDLVSGTQVAGGYNNTVNRSTVDSAFKKILGSNKIPTPTFQYPSLPSIASRLDILQAETILSNLRSPSNETTFGQTAII